MPMMVAQLGLAMMPFLTSFTSSGLISGTIRGTSGSMRQAWELSMQRAPAAAATGSSCSARSSPTAEKRMSSSP